MSNANQFLQNRVSTLKKEILEAEAVLSRIYADGIQSMSINTGQTSNAKQNLNPNSLQKSIDSLYNELFVAEGRLTGCGVTHASMG